MKLSKEQLKEHIRKIIREHLASEQMFRPRSSRSVDSSTSKDRHSQESEFEGDSVAFFDSEDKPTNKSRQKELADLWSLEQNK